MSETISTPLGALTRRQVAAAFGLAYGTVCRRVWLKYPAERMFAPPAPSVARAKRMKGLRICRRWSHGFRTPYGLKTTKQLAYMLGMRSGAFSSRMRALGWTLEEAVNTPPFGKRGVHFILPTEEYRNRMLELWGDD